MTAITRKIKVMDVLVDMAADVVTKEVMTIPHKSMTMPTLEGQEHDQVLLLWKI